MRLSDLKRAVTEHESKSHGQGKGEDYDPQVWVHPATGNLVCAAGGRNRVDVIATIPKLENKPLDQQGDG